MKDNLITKLTKRFYGLTGPLDEYRRQAINQISNTCFIFLYWVLLTTIPIVMILVNRFPQILTIAYPTFILLLLMGLNIYANTKVAAADLNQIEKEELTEQEKKDSRFIGIKSGLSFALIMYFGLSLLSWGNGHTSFVASFRNPKLLIGSLVTGLIFGTVFHLITKSRLDD